MSASGIIHIETEIDPRDLKNMFVTSYQCYHLLYIPYLTHLISIPGYLLPPSHNAVRIGKNSPMWIMLSELLRLEVVLLRKWSEVNRFAVVLTWISNNFEKKSPLKKLFFSLDKFWALPIGTAHSHILGFAYEDTLDDPKVTIFFYIVGHKERWLRKYYHGNIICDLADHPQKWPWWRFPP